ncbi:MAG: bifunctional demethylmenaquinone methyltransferase/2-methoxy-6-polyprenyl-1,4-benzoquinol methylase UbiE [Bacteroidales bacterium]
MPKKYQAEKIVPYQGDESKSAQIERMFDSIAHSYDKLNITLSMGIDRLWRRSAMKALQAYEPARILDVATGTGDLAILEAKKLNPDNVTGIDLSEGMLAIGRQKVEEAGLGNKITLDCQDCLDLKFADNTFDAITVAFGVRNFEELEKGFNEMYRVLKPGGVLLVLELSTPEHFPMKQLYNFYSSTVIPLFGRLVSKDRSAYDYLNKSVKAVPQGEEMASIFRKVGFSNVRFDQYTFGICTNYMGEKISK